MKICLIIYKIDPQSGSENASGYHLAREIIQKYPQATLISRKAHIETLKNDPAFQNVKLIGVDVPPILSFYKKKGRGIILYYYLWQIIVGHFVSKLDRSEAFDVVHQINFHADWAPHFIRTPKANVIWGPIAHHPPVPYDWFSSSGPYALDVLNRLLKRVFWSLNPYLKQAIQRSRTILFANTDIPHSYKKHHNKIHLQHYAGSHWLTYTKPAEQQSFKLLWVGRLVPLKGPHLALDAFAYFLKHTKADASLVPHLTIIGSGPLETVIRDKLTDHVTWHPWLEREDLVHHYQQADYLLYPSLEAQGLVVSEALSQQCLPITLADTGPAFISQLPELTIQPKSRSYKDCVQALGQKLIDLYQDRLVNPANHLVLRDKAAKRAHDLQWSVIAQKIMMFYDLPHG